jgi:DNA-binding CsgD family transcriptional regulator
MSARALHSVAGSALHVAVFASDAQRYAEIRAVVDAAGYQIVTAIQDADVVILDDIAAAELSTSVPTISIGRAESESQGSLNRDASAEQIDAAIRAVATGLIVRSAAESATDFGEARQHRVRALLTPREIEMLSAIASGLSNKAIARQFDISLHTVKFHIESLFRKLGARSRAEAVARGLERVRVDTVQL